MLKTQLMVGSYVNISAVRTRIDEQLLEQINNEEVSSINPIKLDREWLTNFGFVQEPGYWRYNPSDSENVEVFISDERVNRIHFNLEEDGYCFYDEEIQDVHMLQFLCFHKLKVVLSTKEI